MKKPIFLLLLVILVCAVFSCRKQSKEVAEEAKPIFNVEADKEAIKVLVDHFFAAHETRDLDALIAVFSDDAIFMPDDADIIDKEAARERFAPSFENFSFKVDPSVDEIEVSGDWGFARCSYLINATPKAEGEAILYDGKFVFILKRQPDNAWRSSHFIWNSNNPPI
jgi:uncharacterized protein (TIGR02246 family)